MMKLMIGLAAVFAVACTSHVEEVTHLDAQLVHDGVHGTFEQGDVRLEFASFELEPGVFAVTIVGDDFAIDTMILPPEDPRPPRLERPTMLVDFGPKRSTSGDLGTFLLPPEKAPLFFQDRPTEVVDFGAQPSTSGGLGTFLLPPEKTPLFFQDRPTEVVDFGAQPSTSGDLGTFLLPPGSVLPIVQDRPTDAVDFGPSADDDHGLADLGAALVERFPEQPTAVTALVALTGV